MSNVAIRSLQAADAELVWQIYREAHARNGVTFGGEWTRLQIEQECGQFGLVHATEGGASLDAFLLYRDLGAALEISLLATADRALRKGRMRDLLEHFLKTAAATTPVWLEVHAANQAARQLYGACGFREVGRRPSYYPDGAAAVLYNYG